MNSYQWDALFPLQLGSSPDRQSSLILCREYEAGRAALEAFIHDCFKAVHQADVAHYLVELIALQNDQGQLIAAAGMAVGGAQKLFLENYLQRPLEAVATELAGALVAREQLVEVGNLASLSAGSARLMIIAVTWLLAMRNLQWVAFTGGPALVNSFHRLGLQPQPIAVADPACLGAEQTRWGSYYQQYPQVYLGNVGLGHQQLLRSGIYQSLGFPRLTQDAGHAA